MNVVVRLAPSGTLYAVLEGDLDTAGGQVLRERLDEFLDGRLDGGGPRRLVVDAGAVTFADVAGLRVLLWADTVMRGGGGTLVLRRPGRPLLRVIALLGFDDLLSVE
ncbi:STAS domain-containing protein [Nonomuraea typhae]|uniref:STAS domain-containing protein n=1 Tax=Nonomuraea typhae TaxID=2603600 RepID=UPI0012FC622A|nr:STAS domain-containing protein [Nonomuraea typhae]